MLEQREKQVNEKYCLPACTSDQSFQRKKSKNGWKKTPHSRETIHLIIITIWLQFLEHTLIRMRDVGQEKDWSLESSQLRHFRTCNFKGEKALFRGRHDSVKFLLSKFQFFKFSLNCGSCKRIIYPSTLLQLIRTHRLPTPQITRGAGANFFLSFVDASGQSLRETFLFLFGRENGFASKVKGDENSHLRRLHHSAFIPVVMGIKNCVQKHHCSTGISTNSNGCQQKSHVKVWLALIGKMFHESRNVW